jgi:hypothetical protein
MWSYVRKGAVISQYILQLRSCEALEVIATIDFPTEAVRLPA